MFLGLVSLGLALGLGVGVGSVMVCVFMLLLGGSAGHGGDQLESVLPICLRVARLMEHGESVTRTFYLENHYIRYSPGLNRLCQPRAKQLRHHGLILVLFGLIPCASNVQISLLDEERDQRSL